MLTLLGLLLLLIGPCLAVAGVVALAGRIHQARERAVARQIRLTDAIHRELGAVVAPVVKTRFWGPWKVLIPVPLGRPALVGSVVAITHRTLVPERADAGRVQIVLTPQAEPAPAGHGGSVR